MKRYIFILLFLIIPLFILFPGFSNFILPQGSAYSDLLISHYPNLIFLQKSLSAWGEIPLWSNTILSGYPFFANPLSGLWYPFTWVLLLFPQPFGYNFIFLLHLFTGGLGIFFCLKLLGKRDYGALVGALTFELMPKIFAHLTSGHITLLFAVCITPWLIYIEQKRRKSSSKAFLFLPGIILGLIALADLRWTPFAFLLWGSFKLYSYLTAYHLRKKVTLADEKRSIPAIYKLLPDIFLQAVIAAGIAAPIVMPMLQYSSLSTRSSLGVGDRLFLSLPPLRFLGLIFPDIGGYSEFITYPGIFSICALLYCLMHQESRKQQAFWILVLLASFAYALGSYNPLMPLISSLPGFNILRVPTRVLFLAGIAFAMMSGTFSDQLTSKQGFSSYYKLALIALCSFSVILNVGLVTQTGRLNIEFFWGALFFTLAAVLILFSKRISEKSLLFLGLMTALLVFDLGTVNFAGFNFKSKESQMNLKDYSAELLSSDDDLFRVYSPSYSIPQQVSASFGLEMADGIDPLQLSSYVSYMQPATGVPWTGYSVTLPSFAEGSPAVANRNYLPAPDLLGYLNIKYVVSEYDLDLPELRLLEKQEETRIYKNTLVRPRAWMQEGLDLGSEILSEADIVEFQPNKISLMTRDAGVLVLSEVNYPGWIVTVDGEERNLEPIGGLLRGVVLQPGNHEVVFIFKPKVLYSGMVVMLCTLLITIILSLPFGKHLRKEKNESH